MESHDVRLSPQVQRIQSISRYTNIYTNAERSPLRSRPLLQPTSLVFPRAHAGPKRWENPGGWGARHMHDKAPFNLWVNEQGYYRGLKGDEITWVMKNTRAGDGAWGMGGWYLWIESDNPPQPVPLTIGCMSVVFVPIGSGDPFTNHNPAARPRPGLNYMNLHGIDPCPDVHWPRMQFPNKEQNSAVLNALKPLANVRGILYFPDWTVVELEFGDGRIYQSKSLPNRVAGLNTMYVHTEEPFFNSMTSMTRARSIDPSINPLGSGDFGPSPQDDQNYLRHQGRCLSPGCRVECGTQPGGQVNAATSAGVKLRNRDGRERLTVAHHGFLISPEVWHPYVNQDRIGTISGGIVNERAELDISLVELTPEASRNFRNDCYFQAETPQYIASCASLEAGSFSEVDGMSSGLVTLRYISKYYKTPTRPPGHPKVEVSEWKEYNINAMFGACNTAISDGMCGAPMVRCEDGGVVGFFHLSNGAECMSATLEDLIAEGWNLA